MRKVAFHIQKGGVGKTTLSGNVAYALSQKYKTALIDADPQGSCSGWLLSETPEYELADVLNGDIYVENAIIKLSKNLFMLPTFSIAGMLKQFEPKLLEGPFIFEDLCQELEKLNFQFAIFDLSPGMSMLEKCVILSMDEVITPLTPEYFSIDGIKIFRDHLRKINKGYKRSVRHRKIICNALNMSFVRHREILDEFKKLDFDLFTVAQDAKIAMAQGENQSIFEYYPKSKTISEIKRIAKSIAR